MVYYIYSMHVVRIPYYLGQWEAWLISVSLTQMLYVCGKTWSYMQVEWLVNGHQGKKGLAGKLSQPVPVLYSSDCILRFYLVQWHF